MPEFELRNDVCKALFHPIPNILFLILNQKNRSRIPVSQTFGV